MYFYTGNVGWLRSSFL